MANSSSFGKKENEKKKQAQRLAKQKKKAGRKSGGGSLEDMIAYVDANGNICDTPPEMSQKKEVDLDSIQISIPKKEETEPEPLKGRVEHFNADKGYGFIKDLANTEKYFFHISSAPQNITEGNIVFFEIERGPKGLNAVRIIIDK